MSKYNFESSSLETTSREKKSKYSFTPSKECKDVNKEKKEPTVVRNVNKIMRFNKEG